MKVTLLNDSFPPLIDGVANTVVNYAQELTKLGDRAIVVTPEHPDADDSRFPFPVARYPSVDTRRLFGYLAGYPFSPETLRQLKEQKVDLLHSHCPVMSTILARSIRDVVDAPLVFTYHTKFDVDVAKLLRGRLGSGNVHTPIDLHGVGGHDLSAVCLCQGDAQGCFAGCGRANHRQNWYFFLLHGRLPTPV